MDGQILGMLIDLFNRISFVISLHGVVSVAPLIVLDEGRRTGGGLVELETVSRKASGVRGHGLLRQRRVELREREKDEHRARLDAATARLVSVVSGRGGMRGGG